MYLSRQDLVVHIYVYKRWVIRVLSWSTMFAFWGPLDKRERVVLSFTFLHETLLSPPHGSRWWWWWWYTIHLKIFLPVFRSLRHLLTFFPCNMLMKKVSFTLIKSNVAKCIYCWKSSSPGCRCRSTDADIWSDKKIKDLSLIKVSVITVSSDVCSWEKLHQDSRDLNIVICLTILIRGYLWSSPNFHHEELYLVNSW